MPRPFVTFPNTAQVFKERQGVPQVEEEGEPLTLEYLEGLTVEALEPLAKGLEIEGSGARGRVLKSDLVEALLR